MQNPKNTASPRRHFLQYFDLSCTWIPSFPSLSLMFLPFLTCFSLFFFFFSSPPTSQICQLFRFSFCLSIPPKPNPNSINQSQNCILTPIPLTEISLRLLPPGNHIGSDRIGLGRKQMRIWESDVRFLNLILNLPFRKRLLWSY